MCRTGDVERQNETLEPASVTFQTRPEAGLWETPPPPVQRHVDKLWTDVDGPSPSIPARPIDGRRRAGCCG